MELNKTVWNKHDGELFLAYLETLANREKQTWSKKILNTNLDVLVIPTKTIQNITSEIYKGNFKSFLDLKLFVNYESIAIYGIIVSKITDFATMKQYLDIYKEVMENWAHCDLLSFNITDNNKDDFIRLSNEYAKSPKVFIRRLGLFILLLLIRDKNYLNNALDALSKCGTESEYYVIMMGGWLLSECIIRYKEDTLDYLTKHTINPKIVNKGIQKCRESLRLTKEEKDALLVYKLGKVRTKTR